MFPMNLFKSSQFTRNQDGQTTHLGGYCRVLFKEGSVQAGLQDGSLENMSERGI